MLHGRWLSTSSARKYLQRGELFLTQFLAEIDPDVWKTILTFARCLPLFRKVVDR